MLGHGELVPVGVVAFGPSGEHGCRGRQFFGQRFGLLAAKNVGDGLAALGGQQRGDGGLVVGAQPEVEVGGAEAHDPLGVEGLEDAGIAWPEKGRASPEPSTGPPQERRSTHRFAERFPPGPCACPPLETEGVAPIATTSTLLTLICSGLVG